MQDASIQEVLLEVAKWRVETHFKSSKNFKAPIVFKKVLSWSRFKIGK